MSSFPSIPELNLTFRTPQPGARCAGIVQSHVSSYSHPLAVPIDLLPFLPVPPAGRRLRSVVNTFIGLRERTSHTATIPSCDATANLEPSGEKAVQKEAGRALPLCTGYALGGGSKGGSVSWARGVKVIRAPPVMPWRYTWGESPTERSVRPSGEIDAVHRQKTMTTLVWDLVDRSYAKEKKHTVVDGHVKP